MIIYIDENMPAELAAGLHLLQQTLNKKLGVEVEVKSVKETFGEGAKDEDWIPLAGEQGACIITQDIKIQHTRHQNELCKQFKVGIFFINQAGGRGLTFWGMVQLCVNNWEEIIKIVLSEDKPFCYRYTPRKGLDRLSS